MKLIRYRVYNFRSVEDSEWIDCEDVTTLVGINESGKSNILLALWKLNPVFNGKVDELHDLPVEKLSEYRSKLSEICFVEAEFMLQEKNKELSAMLGDECVSEEQIVSVKRYYDGHYDVSFDNLDLIDKEGNHHDMTPEVKEWVIKNMPKFVYYSNYGNLSSKIYLPHAVKWLNGQSITGVEKNEDQIRTMRVLFNFVGLDPTEILELGKDATDLYLARNSGHRGDPTKEDIEKAKSNKEKRSILLQSASTELTVRFKEWWSQGEYKFRFEADGDYFRILVADEKRPAEIDLSLRSTGLQWFLSFFLVFLVESREAHNNAILLLDEAGLTLHPLAQKDLIRFFNSLSKTNQIINTTHSPFIVDTENMDKAKVVYSDEKGKTVVSNDLRKNTKGNNDKSIYAVHAALGLSVSDVLLQGCKIVIVEGTSDQHYLNAIKNYLISKNKINPLHEIVFVPSGGVKNVAAISSVVGGKNNQVPFVILDSDESGMDFKKKLSKELYKEELKKILEIKTFSNMDGSEIEDLFPIELFEKPVNKLLKDCDEEFFDVHEKGRPIINQIELFSQDNGVELKDGWKVELAKHVKNQLLSNKVTISESAIEVWEKLFLNLC